MPYIMVLNDGETFSSVEGCTILEVSQEDMAADPSYIPDEFNEVAKLQVSPHGVHIQTLFDNRNKIEVH